LAAPLAIALLGCALNAASPTPWPSAHLLAQADPLAPADPSTMSYPQLSAEYDRLSASRPNLVGPIVLVSGAEVGFAMAADLLSIGVGFGFGVSPGTGVATGSGAGWVLVALGAVILAASVAVGIYGTVRLYRVIRRRFELGAQMDEVKARMSDPGAARGALSQPMGGLVLAEL